MFTEPFTVQNQQLNSTSAGSDILDNFKHIYVKEVVRKPDMHYWKVPRLGSYMAIPLVYKSALSVPSLEASVRDLAEYQQKVRE